MFGAFNMHPLLFALWKDSRGNSSAQNQYILIVQEGNHKKLISYFVIKLSKEIAWTTVIFTNQFEITGVLSQKL